MSECIIDIDGNKTWWIKGKVRREDGQAIEDDWYLNHVLHREDYPAVEYINGDKTWYLNDKRHREDGPAVELANGSKSWWINDKKINCSSNEEFLKLIKLKAFW